MRLWGMSLADVLDMTDEQLNHLLIVAGDVNKREQRRTQRPDGGGHVITSDDFLAMLEGAAK